MSENMNFFPAKQQATLTTGEVIRMLRELKGWAQEQLVEQSGLNAKNTSLLGTGRIDIGKKRAVQLAEAFNIHPAIIMFPEYEADLIGKAA
jgi:transcriptional regulator with XRE-family HTH domain